MIFLKKIIVLLTVLAFVLSSCKSPLEEDVGDAEEVLRRIIDRFELSGGVIYSDMPEAEYFLTDALKEKLFSDGNGLPEFESVVSCAVYVSRRFSEEEIIVLKLCDKSHREALMKLCRRRAAKKENAVLYANGVYIYLVCTDRNEEILAYLR